MRDAHDKIQEVMYNELSVFATEAKFAHLWMSKGFKTTHISSPFIYTVHARVGINRKQIFFSTVWLVAQLQNIQRFSLLPTL